MSREELAKLVLGLDVSDRPAQPILTGLYESPGILIRQEAAIRAFARGAGQQGIEIHPGTEVTSIRTANGRIEGVATTIPLHRIIFSHSSFVGIVRLVNAQLLQQRISMHGKSALQQSLLSS